MHKNVLFLSKIAKIAQRWGSAPYIVASKPHNGLQRPGIRTQTSANPLIEKS